jgi:hypothetical protein
MEGVAREARELFRPDHPGPGRVLASGRIGKATLEVRDFGAGGVAVRKKTSSENAELARFYDLAEARAVARLLLEALEAAARAASKRP